MIIAWCFGYGYAAHCALLFFLVWCAHGERNRSAIMRIHLSTTQPKKAAGGAASARVLLAEGKRAFMVLDNGRQILRIGVDAKKMSRRKLIVLFRRIVSLGKMYGVTRLVIRLEDFLFPGVPLSPEDAAELMSTNLGIANFSFTKYKSAAKDQVRIEEVTLLAKQPDSVRSSVRRGSIIFDEVNMSRTVANTPGGEMTPEKLASWAEARGLATGVSVKVLGRGEIERLGMGALLGVARGSAEEPKFIIAEYQGDEGDDKRPIVFVGKGVTFDTGGINLKPANALADMHMDMTGGAAVLSAVFSAARLKMKKHLIALVPAAENMPSGSSYRPGDILKSMSGKTIEILNTDAEGRVILADALTYAKRYRPSVVIDVATLTGAAMVALGTRASALFTNDEKLKDILIEAGEKSGEYLWPLPLWEEYESDIKGTFGDIANTGKSSYGGAISGAVFLKQFAKSFPRWAHIDIAPRMTSVEGDFLAKGATGVPIQLLIRAVAQL